MLNKVLVISMLVALSFSIVVKEQINLAKFDSCSAGGPCRNRDGYVEDPIVTIQPVEPVIVKDAEIEPVYVMEEKEVFCGAGPGLGDCAVQWRKIDGTAPDSDTNTCVDVVGVPVDIAVGANGKVWVINDIGQIVERVYDGLWAVNQAIAEVQLTRLDVDPQGYPWAIMAGGGIQHLRADGGWEFIEQSLTGGDIAVGADGTVWVVNSAGTISKMNPDRSFSQIGGQLKRISVDHEGNVWGIAENGSMWWHDGTQFNRIEGEATLGMSVGDTAAWFLSQGGEIWSLNQDDYVLSKHTGLLTSVSVQNENNVWGIVNERIYQWASPC